MKNDGQEIEKKWKMMKNRKQTMKNDETYGKKTMKNDET